MKYQLQRIPKQGNEMEVRDLLHTLPRDLLETYRHIWESIQKSDDTEKAWAHRTLSWLLFAKKSPRPNVILEATAITQTDRSFNDKKTASSVNYLVRVCSNLVAMDGHRDVLRFVHSSAREFLQKREELSLAADWVAGVCLNVLSPLKGPNGKPPQHVYRYAALNWQEHVRGWDEVGDQGDLLKRFLLDSDSFTQWKSYCQKEHEEHQSDRFPDLSPLGFMAYFNLPVILQYCLSKIPAEGRATELSKALYFPALDGNSEIISILLDENADANFACGKLGTALHAAAWGGHEGIVKLLLGAGANVNIMGTYGTALRVAAYQGWEKVVELLLARNADVDAVGGVEGTALQAAVRGGHKKIAKSLLKAGANVNASGGMYGTALIAAARAGQEGILESLLEAGGDVNAVWGEFGTALVGAALEGQEKIVGLLLAANANVNATGKGFGTALIAAASKGRRKIVECLLGAGANVNIRAGKYGTALIAAVHAGREKIVELLLKANADVNATDPGERYETALREAWKNYEKHVSKLSPAVGARLEALGGECGMSLRQVWERCEQITTPLRAPKTQHRRHVHDYLNRNLLARNPVSWDKRKILAYRKILKLLLDAGADMSLAGEEYRTISS